MVATNDAVRELKRRFHSPDVAESEKVTILEFFKDYNHIFYSDIDVDAFFNTLMTLVDKHGQKTKADIHRNK